MKNGQIRNLLVLIVLLATIANSSLAGSKTWDFESGSVDWKVANGKWAIKGGIYQETSGKDKAMHAIVGDAKWKNYTVETKIRIDDGRWAGLISRAQNEREYYVFYLNVPNNETEFWRHKKGGGFDARDRLPQQHIKAKDVKIEVGKWYDMKAEIDGDNFTLFLNGKKQGTVQDTDKKYGNSMVGVWAWETKTSFDNLTVSGDGIGAATTAVNPKHKLATTWGRVRQD